jgi:hypothetical protein
MGRFAMYLALLSGWAMFIFDLPSYVETAAKWLPLLSGMDGWLKGLSRAFTDSMPAIGYEASQASILTTQAGLVGILAGVALVLLVSLGAFFFSALPMRRANLWRVALGALGFVILICLYLSTSVMLHTMDGVPLGQALLMYRIGGKLSTVTDPSYLYYGSMVYSSFAVVTGVALLTVIAALWRAIPRSRPATDA